MAGQLYNEKETTNVATGGRISGNDALGKVGDTFETQAQADFQEARSRYSKAISASTSFAMKEALQNYSSDPNKLSEELEKIKTKTAGTIEDNDLKIDFLANFDLQSQSYLSKATYDYNQKIKKENKDLAGLSITDENEMAGLTFENMLTPSSSPDDWVNYNISRTKIEEQLNAKQPDGTDVFTNYEKEKYRSQLEKTNRKSVVGYFSSLSEQDKLNFANKLLTDDVKLAGTIKLSDVMGEKDIDYLQGLAIRYKDGYEEKVKKGMDEKKASEITSTQLIRNEEIKDRFTALQGKKKNFVDASLGDVMDLRIEMQDLYVRGEVDDKTLKEYMLKTSIPIMNKIRENMTERENWNNVYSNLEVGAKELENRFANNPSITNNDVVMADLYQRWYQKLKQEGIDPNENNYFNRTKIRNLANQVGDLFADEYAPGRMATAPDSAKAITGDLLIDFKNGKTTVMSDTETPYKIETLGGDQYKVYYDKDGNETERILWKSAKEVEEPSFWGKTFNYLGDVWQSITTKSEDELSEERTFIKDKILSDFNEKQKEKFVEFDKKYPYFHDKIMNSVYSPKQISRLLELYESGNLQRILGKDIKTTNKLSVNESNIKNRIEQIENILNKNKD